MARKSKNILEQYIQDGIEYDILSASQQWAVTYRGELFQLREVYTRTVYLHKKYRKTIFPTRAIALNLARELNLLSGTELFEVKEIMIK
jgi:hypothetical protein